MKKILILLLSLVPVAIQAAEPVKYYKIDQELVDSIAKANSSHIENPDDRDVRFSAITNAFNVLFNASQVKDRKVTEMLDAIAQRKALTDSLKSLNTTIAGKKKMLAQAADSTTADPLATQATNDINNLISRIEKAQAALDSAIIKMRNDSVAFAEADSKAASVKSQMDNLLAENKKISSDADVKKTMADELVIEDIRAALVIPDGLLQNWDVNRFKESARNFKGVSVRLGTTRPGDVKTISDSIAAYEADLLPAAEAIDKALKVMADKYSDEANTEIVTGMEAIKGKLAKNKMLKPYSDEIKEIASAAADYNRAWRNLTFMLSDLGEMVTDIPAAFNIDEYIESVVGIYSSGKNRYPSYYEKFNQALDNLSSNFKPGMTEAQAKKLLDRINAEIKK